MQSVLSIQSHVVYGYVGNKAATYPLQSMGYDVWPINTVQFSNHTGYGKWKGEIFDAQHVLDLAQGIIDIDQQYKCCAIISGYMGSAAICQAVQKIVAQFKSLSPNIIYLCDPVIGSNTCYVKPEVLDFFHQHLKADIITPNQYEAELLSGIIIKDYTSLKSVKNFFRAKGISTLVITGLKLDDSENLFVFAGNNAEEYLVKTAHYPSVQPINGTGDLFSSVYLGSYLKHRNIGLALQVAVFYLEKVMSYTVKNNNRELQVLSVKYEDVDVNLLPPFINLQN